MLDQDQEIPRVNAGSSRLDAAVFIASPDAVRSRQTKIGLPLVWETLVWETLVWETLVWETLVWETLVRETVGSPRRRVVGQAAVHTAVVLQPIRTLPVETRGRAIAAVGLLLVHGHGEALATLPSAIGEHLTATAGLEAGTEPVGTGTAPTAGLVSALHCEYSDEFLGAGK